MSILKQNIVGVATKTLIKNKCFKTTIIFFAPFLLKELRVIFCF